MRPIASLLEGAPRPPDHLCGLGYSPCDERQTEREFAVCAHAERVLNMVHAYCEIRDSWTGWVRGDAMRRTLHDRLIPELRALRDDELKIVGKPTVTLLAVLDYAARARRAVPAYTPLDRTGHPQPPVPTETRAACKRLADEAAAAALAAKRAAAREYAGRMAAAIERERAEEERRQRAMAEHGIAETPEEAARVKAAVEARIAVYRRELARVSKEAGLSPDDAREQEAPEAGGPVAWRIVKRHRRAVRLEATPDTVPPFAHRLVLIDRGARGGVLRAFGSFELDGRRETVNGVAVRFAHRPYLAARLRRDSDRFDARLTVGQVRDIREARP